MHSFVTLLTTTALVSLAVAKPVPVELPRQTKTFSLVQSVAKPFQAGPVALKKVLQKYKVSVPGNIAAAAETGSVTASPEQYDAVYLCPVTIGGQTLNLDFDTGSADLWVFSSELSKSSQSGHSIYNPSQSKTAKQIQGASWNISYGDGSSASGNVYTDTVTIGGLSVPGQAVELAEQISDEFTQDVDNDGLVGLAFSSINTVSPQQQTTFFDTANSQGLLDQNVFTVDLKKGQPGTYDFGFIDSSKYAGNITYTKVNTDNGFWEFTGTGYAIGTAAFKSSKIDAIADTGTTLLLMDDNIVSAYYGKVKGAQNSQNDGGYVFPCSTTLPNFTVGIGNFHAVIPGSYMNYAPASGNNCFGGLQSNAGIGFSIYGDIFLKSVFAVFDGDNTQVGFAPKKLS